MQYGSLHIPLLHVQIFRLQTFTSYFNNNKILYDWQYDNSPQETKRHSN